VLRRSGIGEQQQREIHLKSGGAIDTENLSLVDSNIVFTRREMDVLQYLNRQAGRPVSREELLVKVWGYSSGMDIETRTVDIHIAKLRRKIEEDQSNPQSIVTVRGAGYRLMVAGT